MSEGPIEHSCVEVLDTVYSSRPDLRDQPWTELYVDGSSFVNPRGERCAGYAVVTLDTVIEAKSLPQGTSAQKAELIALTQALELSKDKVVNIYTDSPYAFLTLQVHRALYKATGLLTSGGKEIKYQHEILQLLEAVWKPQRVVILHCRGHQWAHTSVALGNSRADSAARKAASAPYRIAVTAPLIPQIPDLISTYSKEERDFLQTEGGN
ncbi:Gag-Pol polyprotein [Plecturocebus cupreus]